MHRTPLIPLALGVLAIVLLAIFGARATAPGLTAGLAREAQAAIAQAGGTGVTARFTTASGMPSRHPVLIGGNRLGAATRARVARAVAAIPGVGGVRWDNSSALASRAAPAERPLHCEDDVATLLRSRTILFEEGSSRIDASSQGLLDQVSAALRPCLGAIIAITGHTDSSGAEAGNLQLSRDRANAVLTALVARGIPADGLRATGVGSARPVEGLDPRDPANRRIEFSVVESQPVKPTPVDTPGP
ncbi:OmpA family protein [Altererythrobacter sp. CC-YST694]|uniref:OmpA family protein n=1 Tax=Altererythrobacter sp. CC-YST694 TaxID=2755038 RepID=UPI001D025643|nr:OmpA family protein [Altererythrobacter sp. CC-YST694]MCB5423886.1 OmpA family protein [Altererythrobacter sp. CC-YST694]